MGLKLRAYARHRGCSLAAVQKAIASGRIRCEPDGTIDPSKADVEWKRNTRPSSSAKGSPAEKRPGRRRKRGAADVPSDAGGPTVDRPLPAGDRPRAPDYAEHRAIREAYAARLAKLDFEERTGRLVATDEVKVGWFNILRVLRDRILNLPDRLAAVLAAETDPGEVRTILMAEHRSLLADLADAVDGMKGAGR